MVYLPRWSQPPKSLRGVGSGRGEANYMAPMTISLELEGVRFSGVKSLAGAMKANDKRLGDAVRGLLLDVVKRGRLHVHSDKYYPGADEIVLRVLVRR